jgi:hypothetical protein
MHSTQRSNDARSMPEQKVYYPFNQLESARTVVDRMERGVFPVGPRVGDIFEGIRQQIPRTRPYYDSASESTMHYFMLLRATSLHLYGLENPKLSADDRLADNFDVIFDYFDLNPQGNLAHERRPQLFLKTLESIVGAWGDFLIRTPTDCFKVLVLKLGINSIDDLQALVRPFARECPDDYRYGRHQQLTEAIMSFGAPALELILGNTRSSAQEFGELLASQEGKDLRSLFQELNQQNIAYLADNGVFHDLNHVRSFLGTVDSKVRINLISSSLTELSKFLAQLGVAPNQLYEEVLKLIATSYTPACGALVSQILEQKILQNTPAVLGECILEILADTDYCEQNLATTCALLMRGRLKTDSEVLEFQQLKQTFKGILTPRLAELVIEAPDRESKAQVLADYQQLQRQVLCSDPVTIKDTELIAEVIFLAYRPTGFSINKIQEYLQFNRIQDLSPQLERLTVRREGYPMTFNLMARKQVQPFDVVKLSEIDRLLTKAYVPSVLLEVDELLKCFSFAPKDLIQRPVVLGAFMQSLNDERVKSYQEQYRTGKLVNPDYSEERLEVLNELLRIIPNEPEFQQHVQNTLLKHQPQMDKINDQLERYAWKARKGKFNAAQIEEKRTLENLISNPTLGAVDTEALYAKLSPFTLGDRTLEQLKNMPAEALRAEFKQIRRSVFMGFDPQLTTPELVTEQLTRILKEQASSYCQVLRQEQKKVLLLPADAQVSVCAYISKNVGSFFAKAGAELCTASNTAMWAEDRHYHLNVCYNDQIIMNNMLYFEHHPDLSPHLIARGINPRRDTMLMFDRRSMAEEITRVLAVIAADNNRDSVYIPQQTCWHELSNRDGMAVEMSRISARNSKLGGGVPALTTRFFSNTTNHPRRWEQPEILAEMTLLFLTGKKVAD